VLVGAAERKSYKVDLYYAMARIPQAAHLANMMFDNIQLNFEKLYLKKANDD